MNFPIRTSCKLLTLSTVQLFRQSVQSSIPFVVNRKYCVSHSPNFTHEKTISAIKLLQLQQVQKIEETIKNENSIDWKSLISSVLELNGPIHKRNVNGKIIEICTALENLNAGRLFLNYLKSSDTPLSLAICTMYFKLCYKCKDQLTDCDKVDILTLYESIKSNYADMLVGLVAENVTVGLCLINEYEEALKYLEVAKETAIPLSSTYSALIQVALSLKNLDGAFTLLEDLIAVNPNYLSESPLLSAFVKESVHHNKSLIEKLFEEISFHALIPSKDFVETLVDLSLKKQIPYTASLTMVNPQGVCEACKQPLSKISITDAQFKNLREAIIKNALIGSDVFKKTNPKELQEFLKFIENTAPYDLVVDGLNTSYALNSNNKMDKTVMLKIVVEQFVDRGKKVLILGRKHMKKWRSREMKYIYSNCNVFFTEDLSCDDPFLLFATLYSGLGTLFVSKDFMRGHKFLLRDLELQKTFKLWQQAHQIFPRIINRTLYLKYPVRYYTHAHRLDNGTWHIPYFDSKPTNFLHNFDGQKLWLCLSTLEN